MSTLPWGTQFFNIVNASKNPSQLCGANAFKTASSQMSPPHAPPPPRACKPREREPADSSHTARKPACPSRVSDLPPAAKTAGEASRHSSRTAGQTSDPAQPPKLQCSYASFRRLGCSCFSRPEAQRPRKDRGVVTLQSSSERDSTRQQARSVLQHDAPPQTHKHGPLC